MGLGGSLSLSPAPPNSGPAPPAPSPAPAALPPPSLPPPYSTAPLQVRYSANACIISRHDVKKSGGDPKICRGDKFWIKEKGEETSKEGEILLISGFD